MTESKQGQGGAYVIDPDTGERRLVERTDLVTPEPSAPVEPAPTRKTTKTKE